jgi:formamidopyrimidine-DNA glycosylase
VPELPDIAVYMEALEARIMGHKLERVRFNSPFLLRTVNPPVSEAEGRTVVELRRIGKRVAIGFDNGVWLVLHLMIAGRLHWNKRGKALAAFEFDAGILTLTEAGSQRRASLHLARGEEGLKALDPGGLDPLAATPEHFAAALRAENHTLKRVLTDPHVFSGIGNAYSDEILHRARLSPVALTQKMTDEAAGRLLEAVRVTLVEWTNRLREQAAGEFPEGVTAFRPEMAVHGRFRLPCPVCGTQVERIVHGASETNYCPRCQTGGRRLADRALSRLLGSDWPRNIEESAV